MAVATPSPAPPAHYWPQAQHTPARSSPAPPPVTARTGLPTTFSRSLCSVLYRWDRGCSTEERRPFRYRPPSRVDAPRTGGRPRIFRSLQVTRVEGVNIMSATGSVRDSAFRDDRFGRPAEAVMAYLEAFGRGCRRPPRAVLSSEITLLGSSCSTAASALSTIPISGTSSCSIVSGERSAPRGGTVPYLDRSHAVRGRGSAGGGRRGSRRRRG